MAAPDGLMDLIPVTEQTGIYGRPNFSYRGVFDPLDFGFNDNDALQYDLARGGVLRHRRAQHEGRLHGLVHRGAQRARAEPHAAALHVQLQRAGDAAVHDPGRQPPLSRSACRTSCRRAGTSTIARRRSAFYAQDQWTIGRLTLQGGVRYDRAWSWAPAEGNGTTETSRFNPKPITFERTVSVRGYNDITPRFGARLRPVRQRQDGAQGQRRQVSRSGDRRRHLQLQQSGGAHHHAHRVGTGARRAAGPTATATSSSIAIC